MAVQENVLQIGSSLTYPSTKPIASKSHMEVQVHHVIDDAWAIVPVGDYDLITNSCVFNADFDLSDFDLVNVRVGDTPNDLATQPSDIGIVSGIADEVVIVADIADEVVIVADMEAEINTTVGMEAQIRDITADPLRQSILDGVTNAGRAEAGATNAEAEADRAVVEADRATAQADEIKDVGVVSPVTSVPLLPNNETGTPTVSYDTITGLFTYGIPVGKTGEPASVVIPTGAVTVAELNALVSDPQIGAGYWMLDTGTVTHGDPDTVVTEVNSVLVWLADGYFFNMGVMTIGNSWSNVVDVTVELAAPQVGDDLARASTVATKLPLAGGTMTGNLSIDNADIFMDCAAGSTRQVVFRDISGVIRANISYQNDSNNFYIRKRAPDGVATQCDLSLTDTGNVALTGGANVPTDVSHLTRKDYVDSRIQQVTQAEYDALTPDATVMYAIIG